MNDRYLIILIGAFLLLSACGSPQAAPTPTSQAPVVQEEAEPVSETQNAFGSAPQDRDSAKDAEENAAAQQREPDVHRYNDEFYLYGLKIGDSLDRAVMRLGEPDEYVAADPDYDTTESAVWHLSEGRLDLEIYYDEDVIDSFYMGDLTPDEEQRIRSGLGESFSAEEGLWKYRNAKHVLKIEAFSGEADYSRLYVMGRAEEEILPAEPKDEPASEAPSLVLDLHEFEQRLTAYYRQYYDEMLAESGYAEVEGMPAITSEEDGYFYGTLPGGKALVGALNPNGQIRWAAIRAKIQPAVDPLTSDSEKVASEALAYTALLQAFVSSTGDAEIASDVFDSLFEQQYEQLLEQPVYDTGERTYLSRKSEAYTIFAVMSSEDTAENPDLDLLLQD